MHRSTTPSAAAWRPACSAAAARRPARRPCPSAISSKAPVPRSPTGPSARVGRCRRAIEWVGYVVILPRHSFLLASTWVLLVAQRLHLVPRRFGIPRLSAASLARAAGRRRELAAGRLPVRRVRHGRLATRRPPGRAHDDAGHRCPGRPARAGGRLLRRPPRPCRSRRAGEATGPQGHGGAPGRRRDRGRQRGLRRGDEGLRAPARYPRRARVLGAGPRLLGVARRRSLPSRCATPAPPWWCRTRATSATCSAPRARSAPFWRPPTGCGRRPTTASAAGPAAPTPRSNRSSPARSATARWQRSAPRPVTRTARSSSCRPTPGARCTWAPPGSTCATPPSSWSEPSMNPEQPDA